LVTLRLLVTGLVYGSHTWFVYVDVTVGWLFTVVTLLPLVYLWDGWLRLRWLVTGFGYGYVTFVSGWLVVTVWFTTRLFGLRCLVVGRCLRLDVGLVDLLHTGWLQFTVVYVATFTHTFVYVTLVVYVGLV